MHKGSDRKRMSFSRKTGEKRMQEKVRHAVSKLKTTVSMKKITKDRKRCNIVGVKGG